MVDRRSYRLVDIVPIAGFVPHFIGNRLWEDRRESLDRSEKIKVWVYGVYQIGTIASLAGYLIHLTRLEW